MQITANTAYKMNRRREGLLGSMVDLGRVTKMTRTK